MIKKVVLFGLFLGVFLVCLSPFIETSSVFLQRSGLIILAVAIGIKIAVFLYRRRFLATTVVIAGFLAAFLAISSSNSTLSEGKTYTLWLVGIIGAVCCLLGVPFAFSEMSLRQIERRRADWHRIEHPHGYR